MGGSSGSTQNENKVLVSSHLTAEEGESHDTKVALSKSALLRYEEPTLSTAHSAGNEVGDDFAIFGSRIIKGCKINLSLIGVW